MKDYGTDRSSKTRQQLPFPLSLLDLYLLLYLPFFLSIERTSLEHNSMTSISGIRFKDERRKKEKNRCFKKRKK